MPAISDTQTIARLEQFGKPETDWQGNKTYTLPDGTKMTYTEGGDFVSKTLPYEWTNKYGEFEKGRLKVLRGLRQIVAKNEPVPENYKQLYSPQDQQLIEQYEAKRSQISNDPELEESERQALYDKIDARISAIPHISPQMQEPTLQQRFEASVVTDPTTGLRGTFDPKTGKFNAIEADTVTQKQQEAYSKTYESMLSKYLGNKDYKEIPEPVLIQRAKNATDLVHGRISERPTAMSPKLDELWQVMMSRLDAMGTAGKKATSKEMPEIINKYVDYAVKSYGMSWQQAMYDVMLRWDQSLNNPDDSFNWLLPPMSNNDKTVLARAKSEYIKSTSTYIKDVPSNDLLPSSMSANSPEALMNAGQQTQTPGKGYKVGDIVEKGGKKYKVVGFDTDGEPLVDEVK